MSISFAGYRNGFPFRLKYKSANGLPFEPWNGSTLDGGSPAASSGADVYGQGTYHPIGMTIHKLAELYWRIKDLCVSYDYTFEYDGGSYSASDTALTSPIQIPIGTNAEKEWELCKDSASPIHQGSENLDTVGTSFLEVNYNDVWVIGDLYYPSIRIGMGGIFNTVGTGSVYGGIDNPVDGLVYDFLGFGTLNLWGSNVLATIGVLPPYSGSGTISIQAASWWEYNGKWNTTTGAPA